jgi:hypothetical protein
MTAKPVPPPAQLPGLQLAPLSTALATGDKTAKYSFDHESTTYRSRAGAYAEAQVLLHRLELPPGQLEAAQNCPALMGLLTRFGAEIPLNIVWYEKKLKWGIDVQKVSVPVTIVIGAVALAVTGFLGASATAANQTFTTARVTVALAVAFGVLQMVASALDYKARIGAFWQAMSDLKESLFSFEEAWRGIAIMDASNKAPAPEFLMALYQELRLARKITKDERTSYFMAFHSPTDILQAATSAVDVIRGKRQDAIAAVKQQEAPAESVTARVDQLRGTLIEARAAEASAEQKAAELAQLATGGKATPAQANEAAIAVVIARAEVVRLNTILDQLLQAESLRVA